MAVDLVALGICFFYTKENPTIQMACIILILLFVVLFEFSLGPIPWIYMSEIMTDKGLSVAVLINWLMTLMMALVTPYVIGGYLFIVFGAFCCVVINVHHNNLYSALSLFLFSWRKQKDYLTNKSKLSIQQKSIIPLLLNSITQISTEKFAKHLYIHNSIKYILSN